MMEDPVTQSLDAIKAFLTWKGRAVDPMPSTIEFMQEEGRMVLVLSNKKDGYYVITRLNAVAQVPLIATALQAYEAILPTTGREARRDGIREHPANWWMGRT